MMVTSHGEDVAEQERNPIKEETLVIAERVWRPESGSGWSLSAEKQWLTDVASRFSVDLETVDALSRRDIIAATRKRFLNSTHFLESYMTGLRMRCTGFSNKTEILSAKDRDEVLRHCEALLAAAPSRPAPNAN